MSKKHTPGAVGDLMKLMRQNKSRKKGVLEASWVPYPVGTRIRVTNVAGRAVVGIFAGYKGDVLARIRLGKEESVFATDARIEAVGHDVPIDDWHIQRQSRRTFWATA